MKRGLLFLVVCIITINAALAQQDPLYSQYVNNPFVLNPAYTGMSRNLNTSLSYRKQWMGLEGSPVTINANGHISLFDNTMGAGLMIVSDQIGATSVNEVHGSYAYRIKITSDKTLSFGLQAGIINYTTKNFELNIQDANDPLFAGETNASKLSFGSGIILTSDKFFIGLSVPRMLKTKVNAGEIGLTEYTQHFYAMGSTLFFVSDRIRFKPSVLAKVVSGAPVSVDLNASMVLYENYSVGVFSRNFTTYGILLHAVLNDSFRLGYVMEIPTNKSVGSQFFSYEITLGFRMNVFKFHMNNGITSF